MPLCFVRQRRNVLLFAGCILNRKFIDYPLSGVGSIAAKSVSASFGVAHLVSFSRKPRRHVEVGLCSHFLFGNASDVVFYGSVERLFLVRWNMPNFASANKCSLI